eukprot:COSAG01_NODE_4066_length_5385_cov_159.277336_3_plen_73_part_00
MVRGCRFRAKLSDYRRSGYDRGHMCAAADMKASQHSMDSTFLLTNIAPQVGEGFNRDYCGSGQPIDMSAQRG